jgi:hypothetical protein
VRRAIGVEKDRFLFWPGHLKVKQTDYGTREASKTRLNINVIISHIYIGVLIPFSSTHTTMAAYSRYISSSKHRIFRPDDTKFFKCSSHLLKLALPLIKTHGFTRETLARSVVSLPSTSTSHPHSEPLSDSAITALFGKGDAARRTLIDAWLDDGLRHMASGSAKHRKRGEGGSTPARTIRDVLRARLEYNEPVLPHIPDVCF